MVKTVETEKVGAEDQSLWALSQCERREFENFRPWGDWNPFEINELWLPRTYLSFHFTTVFRFFLFPTHGLYLRNIARIVNAVQRQN